MFQRRDNKHNMMLSINRPRSVTTDSIFPTMMDSPLLSNNRRKPRVSSKRKSEEQSHEGIDSRYSISKKVILAGT